MSGSITKKRKVVATRSLAHTLPDENVHIILVYKAAPEHRVLWRKVMWDMMHIYNKGWTRPSRFKETGRLAKKAAWTDGVWRGIKYYPPYIYNRWYFVSLADIKSGRKPLQSKNERTRLYYDTAAV
jgi:hypothetical protein